MENRERWILHIDMNAFFASVEQQANPALQGLPIVVCGDPSSRTTIAAASYEAREFGLKAGMSLGEARRLCPQARLVVGDMMKYVETQTKILIIFRNYTDKVEAFSIDEAFLDVTGCQRLFGKPEDIVRRIKKRIKDELGLTCSVGIGPNKLVAKLASNLEKPDGLVIIQADEVADVFGGLPVSAVCGIGPQTTRKLNNLGVKTLGELGRYPRGRLENIFGIYGVHLHDMGLGLDDSPVEPYYVEPPSKSMGHNHTLQRDVSDPEELKTVLMRLCEQVGRRLRREQYRGKTVTLTIRYANFYTFTRQAPAGDLINSGEEIYAVAEGIMKEIDLAGRAVRMIGVSVSHLTRGSYQIPLFEDFERRHRIVEACDRINDKFGEFTITRGRLLNQMNRRPRGRTGRQEHPQLKNVRKDDRVRPFAPKKEAIPDRIQAYAFNARQVRKQNPDNRK